MITEDQLEQLAIQWFQDTGWNYVHGAVIAPEGVAVEREERGNIEHRTLNIERRSGEKRSLAEAVRIFCSRQISRQSVAREMVGYRDMVSRFGRQSGGKWGIPTEIPTKWRDFALVERVDAESCQLSRHHVQFGRKEDLGMGRPFRALNPVGDGTQGVALGGRMVPRWGVGEERGKPLNKERRYPIALTMMGPWGSGLAWFMGFPWASADTFRRSLGRMPRWSRIRMIQSDFLVRSGGGGRATCKGCLQVQMERTACHE
jgi:hypothetical protein